MATESIYSWTGCIVFTCAAICVADMLIVKNAVAETARFVSGIFLLCAIAVPAGSLITSVSSAGMPVVPEFSEDGDMIGLEKKLAEEQLSRLAEKTLSEKGIDNIDCSVDLICDGNEVISVCCSVIIPDDDRSVRMRVEEILHNDLGFDMNVSAYGSNY